MKEKPAPTSIVLCADDFGFTPAVSQGILELVEAGRLSAVSCMAASSHFSDFAGKLKPYADRIDIGLHLVLTDLKPLGPLPDLTVDGHLPSIGELIKKALWGRLPKQDIAAELGRQIDAFVEAFGKVPDFIDGHHHAHQLPGIRDIVLNLINERFKASPPWIRVCCERLTILLLRRVSVGRAITIGWFGAALRRRAKRKKIHVNNGFSGIYDFSNRVPYDLLFDRFTVGVEQGTLIMCHPGHVDETLRVLDGLTDQREREMAYFLSDSFPALLHRKALCLGRLDQSPDTIT